jgi:hypothetical protein
VNLGTPVLASARNVAGAGDGEEAMFGTTADAHTIAIQPKEASWRVMIPQGPP